MLKKITQFALIVIFNFNITFAANLNRKYVNTSKEKNSFTISESGQATPIYISSEDHVGVIRVAKHLQEDIKNVTSIEPILSIDNLPENKNMIIVGSLDKSPLIQKIIEDNKIDLREIEDKWETFVIETVDNPLPDVDRALVIVGSDKRGTIYGMFDLSEKIGVSPWYWWADVPVKRKENVYVKEGRYSNGEPKVKYRGIFINDEAPALSGWSQEKYGTDKFNHQLYIHMFELILRLKGNFLWPAMWGRAFYDDDPMNPRLADEYGIVISTSHHEPMMRAHVEWSRYGEGDWNYDTNPEKLREFWKEGIERMGNYESIVTLAMRGDGDHAMSQGANVALLQKIVEDQRKILGKVTGKDVTEIPQVWALYKEVQEYYDMGMRVPDDVTLLLCDDNWGNVRKLPNLNDPPRKGGYGMYYHFDFVGGPRNYKWLNTTQIERVWEQMHLSYQYGVDQIWVVNVGDLKPMEFPISFFLDYAWDPDKIQAKNLPDYYRTWAEEQFGAKHKDEIAYILSKYTKYNSRRKPEMLSPETYSLFNFREAESIVNDYIDLYKKAKSIYDTLPEEYQDAYYQLVLHPVEACSNLNDLYVTVAKNRWYAKQGRNTTNILAEKAKQLYERDLAITKYYNKEMADGKWNHMMDQIHIGYTNWQQPDEPAMPEVEEISIGSDAEMGVTVEGSSNWWPDESGYAVLPTFDPFHDQKFYIEIFNRGLTPFDFSINASESWIKFDKSKNNVDDEVRLEIWVDWEAAPKENLNGFLNISSEDQESVDLIVKANNSIPANEVSGFVESNGYLSFEAEHYSNAVNTDIAEWLEIPNLGRTASSVTSVPVRAESTIPGDETSRLEYNVFLLDEGEVDVTVLISPLINFDYSDGIRFAVSFDNAELQIINVNIEDTVQDWKYPQYWNMMVSNNIRAVSSTHSINKPGKHVLKIWAVDPGIIFQKILIATDKMGYSYLGPQESFYKMSE